MATVTEANLIENHLFRVKIFQFKVWFIAVFKQPRSCFSDFEYYEGNFISRVLKNEFIPIHPEDYSGLESETESTKSYTSPQVYA